ncbi:MULTISPECIES: extracellular solute-binding protein [Microbulbifer]|nr:MULTISPECIES: extracellular solute-binding protein [Microbulbifer]
MQALKLLTYALLLTLAAALQVDARELHVANWSYYIAEDTLAEFEAETGIKVHYTEFDDIEELEQMWIDEGKRFDVIVPGSDNIASYISAGLLEPLDRNRLTGWGRNDPSFMQRLHYSDPENKYAFPYLWGTVGIGYNVQAVQKAFGGRLPEDSWDLLFDPDRLALLDHCGVTLMRSPEEIFDVGLKFLDKDPNSMSMAHQYMVANLLAKVRLHVTDFDSGDYVENLASGKHCMVHGWNGDILEAQEMAREAGQPFDIRYITPREGFPLWIDVLAIPSNALNKSDAYQFLSYLLRPEVIAKITNETQFANANLEARGLVDPELLRNPVVYPDSQSLANSWIPKPTKSRVLALRHRLWQRIIERENL